MALIGLFSDEQIIYVLEERDSEVNGSNVLQGSTSVSFTLTQRPMYRGLTRPSFRKSNFAS